MRSWSITEFCKSSTTECSGSTPPIWCTGKNARLRRTARPGYCRMNLGERREPEIHQESLDFPLHPFQTGVCPQPGDGPSGNTRLIGIQLPGVEIDATRLVLFVGDRK